MKWLSITKSLQLPQHMWYLSSFFFLLTIGLQYEYHILQSISNFKNRVMTSFSCEFSPIMIFTITFKNVNIKKYQQEDLWRSWDQDYNQNPLCRAKTNNFPSNYSYVFLLSRDENDIVFGLSFSSILFSDGNHVILLRLKIGQSGTQIC